MSAKRKKAAVPRRILKVGETYLDRSRGVLVTLEDHEMLAGRRSGRVIVCAADDVIRFPRRWYCRGSDLVEVPGLGTDEPGARP